MTQLPIDDVDPIPDVDEAYDLALGRVVRASAQLESFAVVLLWNAAGVSQEVGVRTLPNGCERAIEAVRAVLPVVELDERVKAEIRSWCDDAGACYRERNRLVHPLLIWDGFLDPPGYVYTSLTRRANGPGKRAAATDVEALLSRTDAVLGRWFPIMLAAGYVA